MTNILYIIDDLSNGGTEQQLALLINRLDRNAFTPYVCTLKQLESGGYDVNADQFCLDFVSFMKPGIFSVLWKLSEFIRKNQIGIVHTFFQDPFLLAALVKPFHNIKLVGSFRDLGFWRNNAESKKMWFACKFFDGFIANSEAVKEHFVVHGDLPDNKVEVIYNGFDVSSIPLQPIKDINGAATVGIVANLNRPVKRVQDFILAAAIVKDKVPDVNFVIVGGGHLQLELEALAFESGLAKQIFFAGMVSNPLDYVAGFSVGVITSETEGFCNAIIEYMACGVPVVATKVGGNQELVQDGINGFLYEPGDYHKLADDIIGLLKCSEERKHIGVVNKIRIAQHFSIESMVIKSELYYGSLGTVHGA